MGRSVLEVVLNNPQTTPISVLAYSLIDYTPINYKEMLKVGNQKGGTNDDVHRVMGLELRSDANKGLEIGETSMFCLG